jgi:hypothetical protein
MNIVRLACNGSAEMLAIIVMEEHEIGDPEGLARWDGNEWTWVEKRTSWTLGLDRYQGQWATVEFDGWLTIFDGKNRSRRTNANWNGLNDMFVKASEIFVVGINGGFLKFASDSWDRIANPFLSDLYSVAGSSSDVYACGAGGLVVRYDGSICRAIDLECRFDFTSVSCSHDGATWAAGGEGELGVLADLSEGRIHALPSRLQFIRTVSASEVYGVDLDGIVWQWNGREAVRLPISGEFHAVCLGRSIEALAIGGRDAVAVNEDGRFRVIPMHLEPSFLARQ